jgi:hypothetical protein
MLRAPCFSHHISFLVTIHFDDSDSQITSSDAFHDGPDYPMDSYRISKPHGVTPMVAISAIYLLFSDS